MASGIHAGLAFHCGGGAPSHAARAHLKCSYRIATKAGGAANPRRTGAERADGLWTYALECNETGNARSMAGQKGRDSRDETGEGNRALIVGCMLD